MRKGQHEDEDAILFRDTFFLCSSPCGSRGEQAKEAKQYPFPSILVVKQVSGLLVASRRRSCGLGFSFFDVPGDFPSLSVVGSITGRSLLVETAHPFTQLVFR
jgi:hypothetical protein